MADVQETVEVPLELLERLIGNTDWNRNPTMIAEARALIPKPKPRLVAVDLRKWNAGEPLGAGGINELPDLLTLLNKVIEQGLPPEYRPSMRIRIRKALGVDE